MRKYTYKRRIANVYKQMVISIHRFSCDACGNNNFKFLNVFASVNDLAQPIASAKVIEVELNDDYFNPNVITIPINESTTLLLKNKGKSEHTFTIKNSVLTSSSSQEKKKHYRET